jgi:hypothetical protein
VGKSKRGIIAASAIGAVVLVGGIIFLLAPNIMGSLLFPGAKGNSNNTTTVASSDQAPQMLLVVLQGDEDSSNLLTQYEANNTQPIRLASGAHIRFDSPDYRTAEGMKVIARDVDGGTIDLLRKSYDVNNEFFVNLDKGSYQLQVQATWFEVGSHIYKFNIAVS